MKKITKNTLLVIISIFILMLSVSCGGDSGLSNEEALKSLPEDFPLKECPLYAVAEVVSVTDKGSEDYLSYEVTFNSNEEYEKIIDYYTRFFSSPITKDFGIAYSLLSVPNGSGYMCNFNIYSSVTKGENGICTVVVTVSDY